MPEIIPPRLLGPRDLPGQLTVRDASSVLASSGMGVPDGSAAMTPMKAPINAGTVAKDGWTAALAGARAAGHPKNHLGDRIVEIRAKIIMNDRTQGVAPIGAQA